MVNALESLLAPELQELRPYRASEGTYPVRLDANESPGLLSREARERLANEVAAIEWHRYPDIAASKLKEAVAGRSGVSPDEILLGVGSDEVIAMLMTGLSRPRGSAPAPTLVGVSPTFVMYRLAALIRGQRVLEVPLTEDWSLDIAGLKRAVDFGSPNLIFIASPNNPTSRLADPSHLAHLIEHASEALVVIDEAYIDYSEGNHQDLYRQYENVALLRTLSKVGFASLRVGWLVARPWLISELEKVRQPYNLCTPSQRLAAVALTDLAGELQENCTYVIKQRKQLIAELCQLDAVKVTPSDANFLWLETALPANQVFESLRAQGVIVRSFHGMGGRLTNQLRVTVGSQEENARFVEALRNALS